MHLKARIDQPFLRPTSILLLLAALAFCQVGNTQTLYKYRGADGEWMYTDRPPVDERTVEARSRLVTRTTPSVTVSHRVDDRQIRLYATNSFYAPAELDLSLDELRNVALPPAEQSRRFVLLPRSETLLMTFAPLEYSTPPEITYHYEFLPGDPQSSHSPGRPYRAPFAVAKSHRVSQAYPYATTHLSVDAHYAVDFEMPAGTNIYAARGGTVFEVASANFRGGFDPQDAVAAANLVRILHDDGTYGVYAHLNRSTIRVKPGDVVRRGQYIADSGSTGFASGPHLHFAVIRNIGMQQVSVAVAFEGRNRANIVPEADSSITAY